MKNPEHFEADGVLIGFNRSGKRKNLNIPKRLNTGNSIAVRQDAKTLQFLKTECNRTAGRAALQVVFSGLPVVHEANLSEFSKALKGQ
ncbi:hypothetical protein BH23BAC3_BH23BAC3_35020 [soil metagenome]